MLNEKTLRAKEIFIIIACIMLLQCLVLLYWQGQRGNLAIDELLSFQSAGDYLSDSHYYFVEDPSWKYGEWLRTEDWIDRLKVSESESMLNLAGAERIRILVHKRPFFGLLNVIMADVGYEASFYQYAWRVLYLNILFFLFAELFIAYCVRELTGSEGITGLCVIMFGFSGIIMSMCEYVRFYMLTILLLLIVICCHLKMWKEKKIFRFLWWDMIALACAYFALLHSELMLITCGSFFGIFFAGLLCCRRFSQAAVYSLPLLCSTYGYVYRKTRLLDVVMHPGNYAKPDSHGTALVTYNLLTITPERAWDCLKKNIDVFSNMWFGCRPLMLAFTALLITGSFIIITKRKGEKKIKKDRDNCIFVWMLGMTAFISILFNILTNLSAERYDSFIITILMIVFWYCISRLKYVFDARKFMVLIALLVLAGAVISQRPESLSYLSIREQPTKYIYEVYNDTDSILFNGGNSNAVYDSIIHTGRSARFMAIEPGNEKDFKKIDDLPDTFVAFCVSGGGHDLMAEALKGTEYEPIYIGGTWKNEIYLCTKKG